MNNWKLIIFDLDDTLVEAFTEILRPGVKAWFDRHATDQPVAIATNQGGVGLRWWMENSDEPWGYPAKYPTEAGVIARMQRIAHSLGYPSIAWFASYAYQTRDGRWAPIPPEKGADPFWQPETRKPAPGLLLLAINHFGVDNSETLMVGDRDEDKYAALAAGCNFATPDAFFKAYR